MTLKDSCLEVTSGFIKMAATFLEIKRRSKFSVFVIFFPVLNHIVERSNCSEKKKLCTILSVDKVIRNVETEL